MHNKTKNGCIRKTNKNGCIMKTIKLTIEFKSCETVTICNILQPWHLKLTMQSANIDFIMHWVQKVSFDSHKLLLVNGLNYVMVVTA